MLTHLHMPTRLSILHQVFLDLVLLHAQVTVVVDEALVPIDLLLLVEVELGRFSNR